MDFSSWIVWTAIALCLLGCFVLANLIARSRVPSFAVSSKGSGYLFTCRLTDTSSQGASSVHRLMIVVLGDTFVSAEQCAESALEEWVQRQGSSQAETLRVWSKGRKIYERDLASERPNIAQLYLDAKKSRDHYAMSFERIDQPVGQSLRPRNISLQEPKVSKEPIR